MSRRLTVSFLLLLHLAALGAGLAATTPPQLPPRRMPASVAGRGGFAPGVVLARLQPGTDPARFGAALGLPLDGYLTPLHLARYRVPAGREAAWASLLARSPQVVYSQPDHRVFALGEPNDPYYGRQWFLLDIQAPTGWAVTTGSTHTLLAVLDSGVDPYHTDLRRKLQRGYNAVLDSEGTPQDLVGHGTWVAGLAAADTNNGIGIAGAGWDIALLPVAVLDGSGSGSEFTVARGVTWAVQHGARVINLSLGSEEAGSAERDAVAYALTQDVVVVAAAGNEYESGNLPIYPAAYPGVMAVGAVRHDGLRARYSNTGPHLSVVAPGGDPTSPWDSATTHWLVGPTRYDGYSEGSGTSGAAPLVAGLAALVRDLRPDLSATEVRQLLEATARDLGVPGKDADYGYGLVDYGAALSLALSASDGEPPVASLRSPLEGALLSGTVSIAGTASDSHLRGFQVQYRAGAAGPWLELYSGTRSVSDQTLVEWQTALSGDGPYQIRIRAEDMSGHVAESAPVGVVVDNTRPKITLLSPTAGSEVTGEVNVQATIFDEHLDAITLEVGSGNTPSTWTPVPFTLMPEAAARRLSAVWNSQTQLNGSCVLRVTASDRAGNTRTLSAPLRVTNRPSGDINGDGRVGIADAVEAMLISLGRLWMAPERALLVDLSPDPPDGVITVEDVVLVLRRALGL